MKTKSPSLRVPFAWHEAGHALIAMHFNWKVVSVELARVEGRHGQVAADSGDRVPSPEELAMLWLAGDLAQALVMPKDWYMRHYNACMGTGRKVSTDDFMQVEKIVLTIKPADPGKWIADRILATNAIIARESAAVKRIAELLIRKGRLSADDLAGITLKGEPQSC